MLPVFVDENAAIGFARNNGGTSTMKHIDIRAAWVQQGTDQDLEDCWHREPCRLQHQADDEHRVQKSKCWTDQRAVNARKHINQGGMELCKYVWLSMRQNRVPIFFHHDDSRYF